MTLRRAIAIAALISGFVALYLHLWKLGLAGPLACGGHGGCSLVQGSKYSWFLGQDVARIGAVGYGLILITATIGSLSQFEDARWPTRALMALIFPAMVFTLYLKYAEFVLLKSFCPWCAVSAVTITLCTILVIFDWRRVRRLPAG
jgi:uncharacterized membrane protein